MPADPIHHKDAKVDDSPDLKAAARASSLEERRAARTELRNVREERYASRHYGQDFELRSVPNGTGGNDILFTGYACVTCRDHDDDSASYEMEDWLGPWTESVLTGSFRKTLSDGCDTAFLLNHEGMTLARTKPGTLKLSEQTTGNPTGLHSEARLDPKNPYVKALRSAVERGDIDEMSFAFRVTRQEWNEDYDRRWITEVSLQHGDVSAVNYGANPHTAGHVAVRSASAVTGWRGYLSALQELREGKMLSAANMEVLTQVLNLVAKADDAVDEAQPLLAELMGVPNPDDDDDDGPNDPGDDNDQDQLSAPILPRYNARARLAALRAA